MIDRDEANEWIERMMDGEEIPPEIETYIRQTSECCEYQAELERAMSALDALNIPEPPPDLASDIMAFIAQREEADGQAFPIQEKPEYRSIWLDIGNAMLNLLPKIHIPPILHREAVPAFVSACVILFGLFISPQVQAGKENPLLERFTTYTDWMAQESDRISDGIYSKANGLIEQVTSAFQRKNKKGDSESELDIKSLPPSYRENISPASVASASGSVSMN